MHRLMIRVSAELSDEMLAPFPRLTPTVQPPQTTLTGLVRDQSELQGVLNYLDQLGVGIVRVVTLPENPEKPDNSDGPE